MHYLKSHRVPNGDLRADGSLTSHFEKACWHLRPLVALYGDTYPDDFTVADLEAIQVAVQKPIELDKHGKPVSWHRPGTPLHQCRPWSDSCLNSAINNIRRFFAWLERNGFVKAGKHHHLCTLLDIHLEKRDRSVPDPEWVEITIRYTSPQIACLIQLQQITAARPSELLN